jgi:nucleoside-diphosphate-sugar epimerase
VYGASKVLAEEMAAYYDRARGVRSVALRFGMFVPEPLRHTGIRFLYGGVDQGDVAAAVQAALEALRSREPGSFAGFNIESAVPYGDDDASLLPRDPLAVIRRHWPDAPALLGAAGVEPWGPINEWYDIRRAAEALGWRPQWGFAEYLGALRAGRPEL